jgi:DNA-binding transcriptional ArsR family regulator
MPKLYSQIQSCLKHGVREGLKVRHVKPSLMPARSLGAREVRALAHPLRLRMLESLADGRSATASMLARELGESSGATSYHLRALAAAELIVEDLDRRKGRERWWTHARKFRLISSAPAEDEEYTAAVAQLESAMISRDEDALRYWVHNRGVFSPEWQESAFIGGWRVYATREQVDELSKCIVDWLRECRVTADERPADALLVHLTYRNLPQRPPDADA